ncbi:MAG: hypothetical protein BAA02_05395 [Paenibacillaceae bacterium ZCTH02-B3]|nr:MAG: hypothetical protein BAA02_05395 [Paenibacillaceae bacterium ZCTH02-B3]
MKPKGGEKNMPISAMELEPLFMRKIKVNRGGPDAVEGVLVGIMADHFALLLPEGEVIYIVNRHVKSVTDQSDRPVHHLRQTPAVAQVPFFGDLLRALTGKTVQINRGGPEKVAGVIVGVTGPSVILKVNSEFVLVRIDHIRSLQILRNGNGQNGQVRNSRNARSRNNRGNSGKNSRNGKSRNGRNKGGRR